MLFKKLLGYIVWVQSFKSINSSHCVKSVQIWSFFWPVFSCIRTGYRALRSKSSYSVWIQENMDQQKLRIWTPFTQWVLYPKSMVEVISIPTLATDFEVKKHRWEYGKLNFLSLLIHWILSHFLNIILYKRFYTYFYCLYLCGAKSFVLKTQLYF